MSIGRRRTLAIFALTLMSHATPARAQTAKDAGAAGEAGHVVARAWLDEDQIPSAATVRLWISIDNNSAADINGVGFDEFQTPGLSRGECWSGHTPACRNGAERPLDALPAIPTGSHLVTWAMLKRDDSLPDGAKVVVTGLFHWTPAAPTSQRKPAAGPPKVMAAAVASNPIELLPTVWYKAPWLASVRDFAKDLLIPFAVLLGSLLFSFMLQKRAERQVILTEMLEKVTKDAERHLLPTSSAASRLIDDVQEFHRELGKAVNAADRLRVWTEHQQKLLFALIAFVKQTRYLKNTIGGFYLKLQSAEQVAARGISAFSDCHERRLGAREELDRVVTAVLPSVTYGSFQKRIDEGAKPGASEPEKAILKDIHAVEAKLQAWVTRAEFADQEILALQLMTSILDVEVDRAFQRWYDRAPHVNRAMLRLSRRRCRVAWETLEQNGDPSYSEFEALFVAVSDYRRDTAGLAGWAWRPAYRLRRRMAEFVASWKG